MNKYVLRTSLVWFCSHVALTVAYLALPRHRLKRTISDAAEPQPIAVWSRGITPGNTNARPAADKPRLRTTARSGPAHAGAHAKHRRETGTVESKQISDDIRATGTVEIDERLISYVQVRFSGYIRKVFANATYQYVRRASRSSRSTALSWSRHRMNTCSRFEPESRSATAASTGLPRARRR